jgi:carbamoyl-phosphate synthase large subunit
MHGFVGNRELKISKDIRKELSEPTDMRIFAIAAAFEHGISIDEIYEMTKIDKWFLQKLKYIYDIQERLKALNSLGSLSADLLIEAKKSGFSDFQIARSVLKTPSEEMEDAVLEVREFRKKAGIVPYVKQIDTLAAEYPAQTNYLYLTYHGDSHDIHFERDNRSVVVLGSGAYRIGSSVEFDWCCVNAIQTIRKEGYRAITINYNPETVSTDYDTCDKLYFDELSLERVLDILDLEAPMGVIVSTGGQIPNNLAMRLDSQHVPILGTSALSIDRAEDRHKFSMMCDGLGIDQPRWKELAAMEDIYAFSDEVGFPLLIRPSYVLSGAAMNVVSNRDELKDYLELAVRVSKQHPVVVTEFLLNAKEVEVDAVARQGEVILYAIGEHVEYAGVHSGDATIVFPPQKLYFETVRRIKKITRQIAKELNISGPFNIQFLARDNEVKVIECNLRASRSMPFVSKILKVNLIELATKVMLNRPVEIPDKSTFDLDYLGVKASQFSFHRLLKADPVLGVEMASTGEVGCLGEDFHEALLKSMLSVGYSFPKKNILLSTGTPRDKVELLEPAQRLVEKGYQLYGTKGTAKYLEEHGVKVQALAWPDENEHPNALDYIREKKIDMVVNVPKNLSKNELQNDYVIRRSAVDFNIPLITNARLASAFLTAICRFGPEDIKIQSWDEYK